MDLAAIATLPVPADTPSLVTWDNFARFATTRYPTPPAKPATLKQLNALPPAERDAINHHRIHYHATRWVLPSRDAETLTDRGLELLELNQHDPNASPGLLICGDYATGKTTIATHLGAKYHNQMIREHGPTVTATIDGATTSASHVPVLYTKITENMTTKQSAIAMCRYLGISQPRTSRYDLVDILQHTLPRIRTRLIICDDVHRLVANRKAEVAGFLKDLADLLPVTFVFVHGGAETTVQHLGPEILNRFHRQRLRPTALDDTAWTDTLNTLEARLDLYRHTPGTLAKHAAELHALTGGWVGKLANTIRTAAIRSIHTRTERITITALREQHAP